MARIGRQALDSKDGGSWCVYARLLAVLSNVLPSFEI